MSKRPTDRYATCGQLADDLQHWLDDEPVAARRLGLGERTAHCRVRRKPALAATGGLAGVAILVSLVTAILFASYQSRMVVELQDKDAQTLAALDEAKQQRARADERAAEAERQQAGERATCRIRAIEKGIRQPASRNRAQRGRLVSESSQEVLRQKAAVEQQRMVAETSGKALVAQNGLLSKRPKKPNCRATGLRGN